MSEMRKRVETEGVGTFNISIPHKVMIITTITNQQLRLPVPIDYELPQFMDGVGMMRFKALGDKEERSINMGYVLEIQFMEESINDNDPTKDFQYGVFGM